MLVARATPAAAAAVREEHQPARVGWDGDVGGQQDASALQADLGVDVAVLLRGRRGPEAGPGLLEQPDHLGVRDGAEAGVPAAHPVERLRRGGHTTSSA